MIFSRPLRSGATRVPLQDRDQQLSGRDLAQGLVEGRVRLLQLDLPGFLQQLLPVEPVDPDRELDRDRAPLLHVGVGGEAPLLRLQHLGPAAGLGIERPDLGPVVVDAVVPDEDELALDLLQLDPGVVLLDLVVVLAAEPTDVGQRAGEQLVILAVPGLHEPEIRAELGAGEDVVRVECGLGTLGHGAEHVQRVARGDLARDPLRLHRLECRHASTTPVCTSGWSRGPSRLSRISAQPWIMAGGASGRCRLRARSIEEATSLPWGVSISTIEGLALIRTVFTPAPSSASSWPRRSGAPSAPPGSRRRRPRSGRTRTARPPG